MVRALAWNALWLISSTSLVSTAIATGIDATAPIVDLGYAKYQGYFDAQTNITNFLSVRYAAPPLGELRFQAPQPPVKQSGVQPATQGPTTCYEASWGNVTTLVAQNKYRKRQSTTPDHSEDCLFLNVFVPGTIPAKLVTTSRLPVLVWIHGGGYDEGNVTPFFGTDLVVDSLNTVIVVVVQYRLGAFGFLAGNEVKAHGALNAGLLDQDFALKWVQDYIGLFGGDKDHVTIWGESAGAGSVLQHIVARGGNTQPPLFHAAITSSTYLPPQYCHDHRVPQSLYNEVATKTGCASRTDNFTCIQSVDATILDQVNQDIANSAFYHTFAFLPVVDGTFITERPTVTLTKGQVNGRALLAIANEHEGNMFVNENETLTITEYISQLFPDMTSTQVQAAADVYQGYGTAVEQAIAVVGDSIFVCPTYYPLKAFAGRAWKGLFAIPPAYHSSDVFFYFYSLKYLPYNNTQFISSFSQSFMSFAKNYDVNKKLDPASIIPSWKKYSTKETEMLFNRTEDGVPLITPIKTDPAVLERCAFWATVTAETAQ